MIDTFVVKKIEIQKDLFINLLLAKDMNLRELIECYIQIEAVLDDTREFKKTKKIRFVTKDKIINFDTLIKHVMELLKESIKIIEAIDSGVNLTQDFYLEVPGIDNSSVEVRKELKKSIANINEYKLQPYIIILYTILTSYKGTDTLQQRKYQKMIEDQEYMRNMKGMF